MSPSRRFLPPLLLWPLVCFVTEGQNRIGTGEARRLYDRHCATCHGADMGGGLGGSLLDPSSWKRVGTSLSFAEYVKAGDADLGMPPFEDEINLIERGFNYGWPVITHGMNYGGDPITDKTAAPGMEQPAHHWTPSIAVCGIDFYEGTVFPEWTHDLFVGGLASNELHRLEIVDREVVADEVVLRGQGRVRDVASGPDGHLYLVLNGPGRIVRLVPAD